MKKILMIIIGLLVFQGSLKAKDIWIYSDDGTWLDGIVAFEQLLNHNKITHKRILASDLNNSNNYSEAEAICFPGGYSYNYKVALNDSTINNLRSYVANGGNYVGICAGAFFACSSVSWEGSVYPYQLALFNGKAIGPMDTIAVWDNYAMTNITLNKNNPILKSPNSKLTTLYFGGPYFTSSQTDFDTVATYDLLGGLPAIINFTYQNGKVLLVGPHLEIEENSDRDSTDFAKELNDVESDWDTLTDIVKWLIGDKTGVDEQRDFVRSVSVEVYTNLSNTTLLIKNDIKGEFKYQIQNTLGQMQLNGNIQGHIIDISKLHSGLYFIQFIDDEGNIFDSKFIKN